MKNFNHLYYFYIIARLKSVTAAAKFLNTSQPSLSTQIKTLELNLKKSLFIKRGKYLELTSDGAKVYSYCSRMFEIYEDLEDFLSKEQTQNVLHIGFSNEISRQLISNLINDVLKTYAPKVRPQIKLTCASHDNLIEQLRMNRLDYALTNASTNLFELKTLHEMSMPVLLVGKSSLIEEFGLKGIKQQDVILKKVSPYLSMPSENVRLRIETNVFLAFQKLNYHAVFESDIPSSIVQSAVEGISFAFLPRQYIIKELQDNHLKNLGPRSGYWRHNLMLVGDHKTDATKKVFLKKLIHEIDKMN